MNYFDIVVGVIFILAIVKGFRNGLIIELATLLGLVLGIFGAVKFSGITESYLMQYWNSQYIGIVAFIITFLVIVVGVQLMAKALDALIKAVALGTLNRIMGSVFSLLKYAFVVSVLLAVINSFDRTFKLIPQDMKESSILYDPLSSVAPMVFPYLNFEQVNKIIPSSTPI